MAPPHWHGSLGLGLGVVAALLALLPAARADLVSKSIKIKNNCEADGFVIQVSGAGQVVATPSTGSWSLPAGSTMTLTWPNAGASLRGNAVVWSGNLAMCRAGPGGDCGGDAAACAAGACSMLNNGPRTLAEITLQSRDPDFFDISIINGVNVPAILSPVSDTAAGLPPVPSPSASAPYFCAAAGGAVPAGSTSSTWSITPPSASYVATLPPPDGPALPCSTDADCEGSLVCGLAFTAAAQPPLSLQCGTAAGFWSSPQVCGLDSTLSTPPFNCANPVAAGPTSTSTVWDYAGCLPPIASCFTPGAPATCCGCSTWEGVAGVVVPPASITGQCYNTNEEWTRLMLPQLTFLKAGCGSCYTFPYDDKTSTFTCDVNVAGLNTVDYDLAFCMP